MCSQDNECLSLLSLSPAPGPAGSSDLNDPCLQASLSFLWRPSLPVSLWLPSSQPGTLPFKNAFSPVPTNLVSWGGLGGQSCPLWMGGWASGEVTRYYKVTGLSRL